VYDIIEVADGDQIEEARCQFGKEGEGKRLKIDGRGENRPLVCDLGENNPAVPTHV